MPSRYLCLYLASCNGNTADEIKVNMKAPMVIHLPRDAATAELSAAQAATRQAGRQAS